MDKLSLREAVIVEGRYDRVKLMQFIATPVMETGGFRVFSDRERQALIREIAEKRGILVMTDADSAGFVIRNFLSGIVPPDSIKHAYIPPILGKESRKDAPSKEGLLGVEGMEIESLIKAIEHSGATIIGRDNNFLEEISKADFYKYGLSGRENSEKRRSQILTDLGLPRYLSANAMLSAVNCLFSKAEFESYLKSFELSL